MEGEAGWTMRSRGVGKKNQTNSTVDTRNIRDAFLQGDEN